jgi:hypothetical protein
MKKILRSKSDTNIFFDKESLDLIHENMNKFKISKGPKLEFQKRSKVKKSMNSYFAVRKKSTCQDGRNNFNLKFITEIFLKTKLLFLKIYQI